MSVLKSIKSIDELKHPHLKGEFTCASCQHVFFHRASLNRHRRQCLKQHTCLLCGIKIGHVDALRQHMKVNHGMNKVYTCGCCAFTFENKKVLNEHYEQMTLNGTADESKMIGTAGQLPGSLLPRKGQSSRDVKKSGSLSPCSSSSSSSNVNSTCTTPVPTPKEITPIEEDISEEPMNQFQKMTSEIIGNMLDNGWYSDEQIVLPETWEKMVGEAQKMAREAFGKTASRGTKRTRVE